jgi:hypothetical protein
LRCDQPRRHQRRDHGRPLCCVEKRVHALLVCRRRARVPAIPLRARSLARHVSLSHCGFTGRPARTRRE